MIFFFFFGETIRHTAKAKLAATVEDRDAARLRVAEKDTAISNLLLELQASNSTAQVCLKMSYQQKVLKANDRN